MGRIKANFYMIDGNRLEKITASDRAALSPESQAYWSDKEYWYVNKKLPDGRLYSGWGFQHPTKLTPKDLPPDYILLNNYKKHGYIRTAGVKDLLYHPSLFHNHAFKDDFLYISYSEPLGEYDYETTFKKCDEYIFGNDIVDFIFAVEKWSPEIDVQNIKQQMVAQYNLYCDEMSGFSFGWTYKKINELEDLR